MLRLFTIRWRGELHVLGKNTAMRILLSLTQE
jgi:hypothetical protein